MTVQFSDHRMMRTAVDSIRASVVLPTHGRRQSLLRVLDALARQTVPAGTFEVIVICDGDVDDSAAACQSLASGLPFELRVLEQENAGPAAARNLGVKEAYAPLIIFIDDDVVPEETLIAAHMEAQAGQEMRVTIGPLLPPPDARLSLWAEYEERMLCRQYDAMTAGHWPPTFRQFYTGNASVLRSHLLEAGGFDAAFRRAEDVELAYRLHERGLHFVFLPQARGWHYVVRSFASWRQVPCAYGEADVAMARAGMSWILSLVSREYGRRNRGVRTIVGLCVGRPVLHRPILALLSAGARLLAAARFLPGGRPICSLIWNLCYYDSLVRALGGRRASQLVFTGATAAKTNTEQRRRKRVSIG